MTKLKMAKYIVQVLHNDSIEVCSDDHRVQEKLRLPKAQLEDLYHMAARAAASVVPKGQVWELKVTLTFPVLPEDVTKKHEGDAEVDFERRAYDRFRPHLQKLADEARAGYCAEVRSMRRCF